MVHKVGDSYKHIIEILMEYGIHFGFKNMSLGMDMYTLLYLKWITNKDLLYNTWNCAQCYGAVWMGGEFEEEGIHVYELLSPFAIHLKLSKHC